MRIVPEKENLSIYNSLSRQKEVFIPLCPGKIGIYICGPTVYDHAHIGHARSAVFFDTFVRYLRHTGYTVNCVRNISDTDDKIIARAKEQEKEPVSLAEAFLTAWQADTAALNIQKPDHEPGARHYIVPMQSCIRALLAKGHAYKVQGNVYFSLRTFPEYGKLSGRFLKNSPAGYTKANCPGKQHPADFALWKSAEISEPGWESPWGRGRPGWHLECTAMSREILGEQFDIHGGGRDLIFPHHENEIAQSRALSGKIPARYWMHHGMVTVNGKKMSKSGGNFQRIRDLLLSFSPEVIRFFLLSKHYRNPLNFTLKKMEESKSARRGILLFLQEMEKRMGPPQAADFIRGPCWREFCRIMNDDVNTPAGISLIFQAIRKTKKELGQNDKNRLPAEMKKALQIRRADILKIGKDVLGVIPESVPGFRSRIQ